MSGISPKLPLAITTEDGFYALNKTYEEAIKQNLKVLCLTNPGERMMDPLFGVGLKRYLFEIDNELTHSEIVGDIQEQVSKYMPFVEIIDIIIRSAINETTIDSNTITVRILYKILPLDLEDSLSLIEEVKI